MIKENLIKEKIKKNPYDLFIIDCIITFAVILLYYIINLFDIIKIDSFSSLLKTLHSNSEFSILFFSSLSMYLILFVFHILLSTRLIKQLKISKHEKDIVNVFNIIIIGNFIIIAGVLAPCWESYTRILGVVSFTILFYAAYLSIKIISNRKTNI